MLRVFLGNPGPSSLPKPKPQIYYSNEELNSLFGKTSDLFLRRIILVQKCDNKKVCSLCSSEYSSKIGNSTLKRHLQQKHPKTYESLSTTISDDNLEGSESESEKIEFRTEKNKTDNTKKI